MNNQEAIDLLDNLIGMISDNQDSDYDEALKLGIKALSAEPCREADDYENEIADLHNRLDIAEYDKERYKEEITTLEAENKCFDGMTNGEVLQALFPNMKTEDTSVESLIGTDIDSGYVVFQRDWWNEPYKAESEESE